MILTFFYMIATSIQAWRISSLKARLCAMFQKNYHTYPSIMLYIKPTQKEINGAEDLGDFEYEVVQNSMTSHLCLNKNLAKLGDLLWYHGDATLCTIYPQQKIDISDWLSYQHGETLFPLDVHNCYRVSESENQKMHILLEADLEIHKPFTSIMAFHSKIEDYGLIIAWTADQKLYLTLESNLDHIVKLAIAVMQGQFYINNGLLLTRMESVLLTGEPVECVYDKEEFAPLSDRSLAREDRWNAYVDSLKTLSNTAKVVSQQGTPLEDPPGVTVFPRSRAVALPDEANGDKYSTATSSSLPSPADASFSVSTAVEEAHVVPEKSDEELVAASQEIPDSSSSTSKLEHETCIIAKEHEEAKNQHITTDYSATTSSENIPRSRKLPASKIGGTTKPPNVLVYADDATTINDVKTMLQGVLDTDRYVIYSLSPEDAKCEVWLDQAALVVVCDKVEQKIANQLVEYIVHGGKLLALCSDVLHRILPFLKTSQTCENELIHFTYGKWKHVCMTHQVFCYEDKSKKIIKLPASSSITDKTDKSHSFDIKVLGVEDKYQAPSIFSMNFTSGGGKALFSQIHLEVDPKRYESDTTKFKALKQSDAARMEILRDLLAGHLGMETSTSQAPVKYSPGFFLGRHESKLEVLEALKPSMQENNILQMPKINIQFCSSGANIQPASSSFLPVMIHQCPDNFSTIEYFENLTTRDLGRLVIYTDVLTSSMDVATGHKLRHGLAVIPRQQTQGRARSKNSWISPKGAVAFTLQLHIPLKSTLGNCISILQHVVAVAAVSAVKSIPGYQDIDLNLKWPNDIYAGSTSKIGGLIIPTQVESSLIICNAGLGINLSNDKPTCCINDMITLHNKTHGTKLQTLSYERYLARVFSELENLLDIIQSGNLQHFFDIYYKYWLHSGTEVKVTTASGEVQDVQIIGIDNFGFLKVQGKDGKVFSVHPDGNTFDLIKGLIAPK